MLIICKDNANQGRRGAIKQVTLSVTLSQHLPAASLKLSASCHQPYRQLNCSSVLGTSTLFHHLNPITAKWKLDAVSVASLFVVALVWASLPKSLADQLVPIYLIIELIFAFIIAPAKLSSLSSKVNQAAPANVKEGLAALHRLLDPQEIHAEMVRDPHWFPAWWTESATLGLGNVQQFLGYTFFANRAAHADACDFVKRVLAQSTKRFASIVGMDHLHDQDHTSPTADFIAHTEQPIKVAYRPLAFYVFTELVAVWCQWKLTRSLGFKPLDYKSPIATYFSYQATGKDQDNSAPPIVFLHGIGLGLAPYLGFIQKLQKQYPGRTIITVQYQHVSMRLSTTLLPTATEVADDVALFLRSSGINQSNVIGHSYGTLVASSLVKRNASLISGLTLIDPVCFNMWLPYMTNRTFHFDTSKHTTALGSMMKGLILRELHCATAMSKRFVWHEMNLWASDIPLGIKTTVVLGGSDDMVPAQSIAKMLSSPAAKARGITFLTVAEMGHGGFLMDADLQSKIVTSDSIAGSPDALVTKPHTFILEEEVKAVDQHLAPAIVMLPVGSLPFAELENLGRALNNIVPLPQVQTKRPRLNAATIMAQCSAIRAEAWCRGHAAAARLKEMTVGRNGKSAQIRRM